MALVTPEIQEQAREAVRRKIRARMAEEGLRYADLAQAAGVGKATLSRLLNGDTRSPGGHWPRPEQLSRISAALNLGEHGLAELLEHEIERLVAVELGVLFGGEGAGEIQSDHVDVELGPAALEGLTRAEIQEAVSIGRAEMLGRLAQIRARKVRSGLESVAS